MGNLEQFALLRDGQSFKGVDFNGMVSTRVVVSGGQPDQRPANDGATAQTTVRSGR